MVCARLPESSARSAAVNDRSAMAGRFFSTSAIETASRKV